MFEKASREKLRFSSVKGLLTVEDLWDLPLSQLNSFAKSINKKLKTEEEEDFLEEVKKDEKLQLSFDIVVHIIKTRQEENKKLRETNENKKKKQKILEILSKKRDNSLEQKTEEELLAELEKLG